MGEVDLGGWDKINACFQSILTDNLEVSTQIY